MANHKSKLCGLGRKCREETEPASASLSARANVLYNMLMLRNRVIQAFTASVSNRNLDFNLLPFGAHIKLRKLLKSRDKSKYAERDRNSKGVGE